METSRLTVPLVKGSVLHSQRLTPVAPWQNPGLGPRQVNESPVRSPSALPDCSSVLRIPGDIGRHKGFPHETCDNNPCSVLPDLGDSAPIGSADG
jgi:hypothetical protein